MASTMLESLAPIVRHKGFVSLLVAGKCSSDISNFGELAPCTESISLTALKKRPIPDLVELWPQTYLQAEMKVHVFRKTFKSIEKR